MLGSLAPPYTLSAFQETQGLTVANALMKSLITDGPNIFRRTPTSLAVSAMSPTVPISPYTAGIMEARWLVSPPPNQYERPMGEFSWIDYMNLPNKLSPANAPSVFMFDRQQDATQLYIWPVAQLGGTINCTLVREPNDILDQTDGIDLPSEWLLGFTYMLADALMEDQDVAAADPATAQRISGHARMWWDKLDNWDRPTSIFIRPYGRKGAGKFWR